MSQNNYNLRPLWNEILRIYDVIRDICVSNKLRFYANSGTMLGAVRHGGFIPWDDDLDLYMPRKDYERFIELSKEGLPEGLAWQSIETDPTYRYLFGKVIVSNLDVVKRLVEETGLRLSGGVYIDVFPLDGLPSSRVGQFLFCVQRGLYRRAVSSKALWGKIALGLSSDDQKNLLKFQSWYARHDFETARSIGSMSPYDDFFTPERWIFRKECFRNVTDMPFDRTRIPVPCGYDEILRGQYGKYMELPPENERHPTHQFPGDEKKE